jgi:hypothetical protein
MPTAQPYAPPGTLSAADAGELIRRARKMLRRGLLTHRELVLVDTLIWSCRKPGRSEAIVSYTTLQRLAHVSRETIARGLRRLGQLGLMQTIKRRVRVAWGGRIASRQATSAYRFPPPTTEFGAATVNREIKIHTCIEMPITAVKAAQEALAETRRSMEAKLLGKGNG